MSGWPAGCAAFAPPGPSARAAAAPKMNARRFRYTSYGVISLPSRLIEPLIALSVAYVGIENLVTSDLKPWRIAIVFCFGLLHGMGFAEALANLHLDRSQFLTTLISFNVGVEAGQLTVIALAAVALALALRAHAGWRRPATRLASAGIGVCGLIWMIERLI